MNWTERSTNEPLEDEDGGHIVDENGQDFATVWEREKRLHNGDLWHNPATNEEYMYKDGNWVSMSIPDEVFDMIDGKAQIFVGQKSLSALQNEKQENIRRMTGRKKIPIPMILH